MTQKNMGTGAWDPAPTGASGADTVLATVDGSTKELPLAKLPIPDSVAEAISSAIQAYDAIISTRFEVLDPAAVGPFTVDAQNFTNLVDLADYLAQKAATGGASAPAVTAAPTISDSTVDFDQVVTVTAGTVSNPTSVTSTLYRWIVNGVAQPTLWGLDASNNAQVVGGTAPASGQALVLEELLYWAGGTPISNKSVQYTLNAGAAVPFNSSVPVVTGTASPGNTLSISGGTWTNSPTADAYAFYVYDGGTPAQGGVLLTSYSSQTPPLSFALTSGTYDGKTLVFGVTATNATGTSSPSYSAPIQVSGGLKPANTSPVGFLYAAQYAVGDVIQLDYGLLTGTLPSDYWSNNPSATGFVVQLYRNGAPIAGGGANVTQYTAVSADQDKTLSYSVTASNGAGISTPAYAAGVLVVAQVGGSGAAINFVGYTRGGTLGATTSTVSLGNVSPPAQPGDIAIIIATLNATGANDFGAAPSGFSVETADTAIAAPEGQRFIGWSKVLTGNEPSTYTITTNSATARHAEIMSIFRGGTAVGNSAGPTSNTSSNTSPATVVFPSVTTTAANQRMVLVAVLDNTSGGQTATWTPPSGFSVVAQMNSTGAGLEFSLLVVMVSDPIASTGATGTKSATVSFTSGAVGWICDSYFIG